MEKKIKFEVSTKSLNVERLFSPKCKGHNTCLFRLTQNNKRPNFETTINNINKLFKIT